ncbi:MAG: hypothetical protein AAGF29_07130 [Pseudomonadota bacterium]
MGNPLANETAQATNAFSRNAVLNGAAHGLAGPVLADLAELTSYSEARQAKELARLATLFPPLLDGDAPAFDFHPAFHALARRGVAAGLAGSVWGNEADEAGARHLIRALKLATVATLEPTHITLLSHTHASMAALMNDSDSLGRWAAGLMSKQYDTAARPVSEKQGLTVALAVDVAVEAKNTSDGWKLNGRNLPLPAPAADLIIVRGVTEGRGETCFVVERHQTASQGLYLSSTAASAACDLVDVPARSRSPLCLPSHRAR